METMYEEPRYLPAGDKGILVQFGNAVSPEINRKVRGFLLALEGQRIPGIVEVVPAYCSALVYYDPLRIDLKNLLERLRETERLGLSEEKLPKPRIVVVPTVYGGEYGSDLDFVAKHNGLTPEEVIQIHTSTDYLVYYVGFSPGLPYLGGMSRKIAAPRLETPRPKVPAGSVAVANQTIVYPTESPGGWRLIGRTPVKLFDPAKEPPAVLRPGDYVRFVRVTEAEFQEMARKVVRGEGGLTIIEKG